MAYKRYQVCDRCGKQDEIPETGDHGMRPISVPVDSPGPWFEMQERDLCKGCQAALVQLIMEFWIQVSP